MTNIFFSVYNKATFSRYSIFNGRQTIGSNQIEAESTINRITNLYKEKTPAGACDPAAAAARAALYQGLQTFESMTPPTTEVVAGGENMSARSWHLAEYSWNDSGDDSTDSAGLLTGLSIGDACLTCWWWCATTLPPERLRMASMTVGDVGGVYVEPP